MNDKHTLKGYIAISISMLFWGFSFVWSKQLLNAGFPVFTIVFFRLLIASVIFVTLFCIQHKLEKIAGWPCSSLSSTLSEKSTVCSRCRRRSRPSSSG